MAICWLCFGDVTMDAHRHTFASKLPSEVKGISKNCLSQNGYRDVGAGVMVDRNADDLLAALWRCSYGCNMSAEFV